MFAREEIIGRSKFVYKFSLTVRRTKVSSFQGLNEVNLFLVTRWILWHCLSIYYEKPAVKTTLTTKEHFFAKKLNFCTFCQFNLKFNSVKGPTFETGFKIFDSCSLYIQHLVTRNKFTLFRSWKLETLVLFTVKENLYTNLLRTIISSLVNKYYYYIVILFLCYVFPLPLRVLYFPCYVDVSLVPKLERIFSKTNKKCVE